MLASLLRFEMRYHFKQIIFQAAVILFFGLGFLMPQGSFGGPEIYKNGPYVINFIVCLLSIFMIFVSALFCANVVLRDKSYQTEALIFSTGISKCVYFGIKLLGLLLSVFLIMFIVLMGILAGSILLSASQKGGFQMLYYLQPLLLFGLPNALFCSIFIFAAAMWTQNARAVYVAGVFLFILYFTASIVGNSPLMASSALKPGGPGLLAVLADPFGITAFFGEMKSWSISRKNHDLYPLKGTFLANRLLWTGIAFLVITLSYNRFKFSLSLAKQTRKVKPTTQTGEKAAYRNVALQSSGRGYFMSALSSQLRLELAFLFRQQHFLFLLALWIFLYSIELKENLFHGSYDIRFYATTALVIEQLLPARLALLLLVFYASELIHREHTTRIHSLVFATPVPNAILFLAKTVCLAALIAVLITSNILTGIALQFIAGYHDIVFLPYLSLYYYSGFQLLLFAVLIIFIQMIIPNKYLGMLLSLVIVGVSIFGKMLGLDHYLLRFGSAPTLIYSAINGYGHYAKAFHVYMLFWTILACLLGLLSVRWWPDGTHDTLWKRMSAGLSPWNVALKFAVFSGLLLLFFTGIYIVQKSEGIAPGEETAKNIQWQKRYEQKYKSAWSIPQPVITAIKISTDIYPDEQRYTVSGTYKIKNESDTPISKFWLGLDPSVNVIDLQISGTVQKSFDADFTQYFYETKTPLLPGEELSVVFSLQVNRSGFRTFDSENSVVSNGSYIELEKFLPFFGYNDGFELNNPQIRQKNGLAPQVIQVQADHRYHLVDFDNTISTNADQQVVTVGNLQKSWKNGNRRYFHYKAEQPIAFMFAVNSARYAVKTEIQNGTTFRIFYHPGQTQNLSVMMLAMKDAIGYGNAAFGQYPLKQITLAEIPAYRGAATAYPGVIFSNEKYNFLVDASDTTRMNLIYATTAHEVAHQWWAYKIRPQTGAGDALLTESLAKYTEAMVTEKRQGKMRLRKYFQTDNDLYFSLRNISGQKELALNKTWEQPFVHYQKGGLAMYAIKEVLGEDRLNKALKRLTDNYAFPNKKPSTEDLIYELKQNTNPFEQSVIDQHLKKIIVYDNSIKILSSKAIGNGRFKLQLQVNVEKTDETNVIPKKLHPNDLIDIAIFGSEELSWNQATKPIYFQKHHFEKSQTVIEVVIDKAPKVVAVDPYGYLLDDNRKNNISNF
jgi:ABC-2 type transport system permease protein